MMTLHPVDGEGDAVVLTDFATDDAELANPGQYADEDPTASAAPGPLPPRSDEASQDNAAATTPVDDQHLHPADTGDLLRNTPFTATVEDGRPVSGKEYDCAPKAGAQQRILIDQVLLPEQTGSRFIQVRGSVQPLA